MGKGYTCCPTDLPQSAIFLEPTMLLYPAANNVLKWNQMRYEHQENNRVMGNESLKREFSTEMRESQSNLITHMRQFLHGKSSS